MDGEGLWRLVQGLEANGLLRHTHLLTGARTPRVHAGDRWPRGAEPWGWRGRASLCCNRRAARGLQLPCSG